MAILLIDSPEECTFKLLIMFLEIWFEKNTPFDPPFIILPLESLVKTLYLNTGDGMASTSFLWLGVFSSFWLGVFSSFLWLGVFSSFLWLGVFSSFLWLGVLTSLSSFWLGVLINSFSSFLWLGIFFWGLSASFLMVVFLISLLVILS